MSTQYNMNDFTDGIFGTTNQTAAAATLSYKIFPFDPMWEFSVIGTVI